MIYLLAALAASAAVYQIIAIIASLRHLRARPAASEFSGGVSILKPIRGLHPHLYPALRSHAVQDYAQFEIVFGVSDPEDPALPQLLRLQAEFPGVSIRVVPTTTTAPNGKIGVLMELERHARHPLRVVSDSDILVEPDYLRRILSPLRDPDTGLVTCLYRATADRWPGKFESLGIATDFAPSAMVAPLFGVNEFGLGATLAFRARDLARLGGFAALADYLADDYQMGKRISDLGLRVELSEVVVETALGGESWAAMVHHQLRWARAIRVSRAGGYAGLPITNATTCALVCGLAGWWWIAGALLALRIVAGVIAGVAVLRCPLTARYWWVIPLRDLFGFGIWLGGLFGTKVRWGNRILELDSQGRIQESSQ
ncbi:MAG TPA: bacteriohopanetetrol glucosamine biosynthesis glycosyltransferase HpnI [Bryobacteraceae bacterium]|nr:bacteriohopanetetrol glucosamine biosynthesis glycosyltransferase HpnI [Bryobacteraceae bacterium]